MTMNSWLKRVIVEDTSYIISTSAPCFDGNSYENIHRCVFVRFQKQGTSSLVDIPNTAGQLFFTEERGVRVRSHHRNLIRVFVRKQPLTENCIYIFQCCKPTLVIFHGRMFRKRSILYYASVYDSWSPCSTATCNALSVTQQSTIEKCDRWGSIWIVGASQRSGAMDVEDDV
jgi:hypothetical protein